MSKVRRSVYQKGAEENKRLKKDIKVLVQKETSLEKIECIIKWREEFRKQAEFDNILKDLFRAIKTKT